MGDYLLDVSSQLSCPHTGSVSIQAKHSVTVHGQSVVTLSDLCSVAGCTFQIPIPGGTKPQPCTVVRWIVPATRVRVDREPVLLETSTALCQSAEQIPQGAPTVSSTQTKVKGV